ncbi:unnamed protein product [Closterium sp. NIES-54]
MVTHVNAVIGSAFPVPLVMDVDLPPPDSASRSEVGITIKTLDNRTYDVRVDLALLVSALKEKISTQVQVPAGSQRLVFRGKVLKDDQTLASYGSYCPPSLRILSSYPPSPRFLSSYPPSPLFLSSYPPSPRFLSS